MRNVAVALLAVGFWAACASNSHPKMLGDNCGRDGEACCGNPACYPGLVCQAGTCVFTGPPAAPPPTANTSGTPDAGPLDSGVPHTPPLAPDAGALQCNPPCLAGETCGKLSALQTKPSCLGDQCQHVTCPSALTCTGKLGNYSLGSGCTAFDLDRVIEFGADCADAVTGHNPVDETCTLGGPNTMHCDFPEGSIDCPAVWEFTGSGPWTYTAGCCGAMGGAPYCGIPGLVGSQRTCTLLTPGNGWAPAR